MMAGMAGPDDVGPDVSAGEDREQGFAALFREHYESLVRLARFLVDDRGTGEEVVQDAFVRVYRAWDRVDDPLRYTRRAVVNGARSRLRHRAVVRRYVPPIAADGAPADEEVVVRSQHTDVIAALESLPRRQRECLVLRYYLDLSEAEIASTLGISTGSVKSHASRGLAALGRRLEDPS